MTERRRPGRLGIELFVEDGAYTTLASAVTILVVLTLVFSSATAAWSLSRAGDVQMSADSAALAGANAVSSYVTVATVMDASVASLGLTGLVTTGAGMVGLLVPPVSGPAAKMIDTGVKILDARNRFAASASKGLKALEGSLPYLVGANAARLCAAQSSEEISYAGIALAVPQASASEFPALNGAGVDTTGLQETAVELEEIASELEAASEATEAAKRRAWIADCGRDGMNMQERAARLTGLGAQDNPDYASSIAWQPSVGLDRARAYYRWRLEHERPQGTSVEARADSAARRAFYRYAYRSLVDARIDEADTGVVSTVPLLPKNTSDVRATSLYTDPVWPSSNEADGLTLHYGTDCPGIRGEPAGLISLATLAGGGGRQCDICRFDVGDLGKTPAASTSIDNGFEYHLREFTQALDEFAACRNREIELERQARGAAEAAGEAFDEALEVLGSKRPRIAPPGRYGCVALAVSGDISSPAVLDTAFSERVDLGRRGAVSAAALAPDAATRENNVLSSFFAGFERRSSSDGVAGLVGSVMDLWGGLLVSYGDLGEGLSTVADGLLDDVASLGAGPVASWFKDRLSGAIGALDIAPVDLRLKKPVLVDSARVIERSDITGLADAQGLLRSIPLGSTDPAALLRAAGYQAVERIAGAEFTVAEIPLPSGGGIPLTIRLRDIIDVRG